ATVIALDMAHGGIRWQRQLGRQLFTELPSPSGDILVVANGLLYVNAQTTILALNAQNGFPAWQTAPGQVAETYDSLMVTAGRFYVIAHADGRQYVKSFDALRGNSPRALQGLDGALAGDLAFAGGMVYALTNANLGSAGPYQYILSAIDPSSGSVLWTYKSSGSGIQLRITNGQAIIAYETTNVQGKNIEGIQAVNLQTHAGGWQRVLHQGTQQTITFTLLNGNIYTASSAGTLTALRATDGTILWPK
ncbi:MAG TPA: PQQ-binding-like beta-propeller repeat protein, partial [Ktedonobacteraceae bacterium]|nr:PQQ-binding-like beta-propeller repeat protein [Ktedonobacteraceae bacterium]